MTRWTELVTTWGSALVPVGRRVHRLGVRDGHREDRVVDAVLDRLDDHRLVNVDPPAVELYLSEEHRHVQGRKRVAPLWRIERPGAFDRALEVQAGWRRAGDIG